MKKLGIKAKIILHLLGLLSLAMLMIDLVMIGSMRQVFFDERLQDGRMVLSMLKPALLRQLPSPQQPAYFSGLMANARVSGLMVVGSEGEDIFNIGMPEIHSDIIARAIRQTMALGVEKAYFSVSRREGLWPVHRDLVVTRPLRREDKIIGAALVKLSLKDVYRGIGKTQRVFVIYFLINILILTLAGFYSLYRVLVKPINRLVDTAEKFTDDSSFHFGAEQRDSEFNKLSRSLNTMLKRINLDRAKLQASVISLEEANLELEKAQEEVIRAENLASIGRLSAGIAHEIGNPIGIVMGYFDLLKNDQLPADQRRDFIKRAESEILRVNGIIRQLLDFASRPAGEVPADLDLDAVIQEVTSLCLVHPMLSNIELVQRRNEEELSVRASAAQLKQVLLNIIFNAADAIHSVKESKAGRILLSCGPPTEEDDFAAGSFVKIEIRDNGSGISPEDLSSIFDPFFTTKDPGQGTGLGLSICFTLIENMGGEIRVESWPGEGSVFSIYLPRSADGS